MDFSLVLSAEREGMGRGVPCGYCMHMYIIIMAKPLVLIIQWNPSKADTIGTTTVCWNICGNLYFRGFQNISDRCGNVFLGC